MSEQHVRIVRPHERDASTAQTSGMSRVAGISAATSGSSSIWMGEVVTEPGFASGAHHHGEVESAIYGHPAIQEVAVIGVPDERWGEAVKAMVVLKPGAEATEADILAFARERIAGFKLPKSVDFIAALPRGPSGKILRRELRAPFWEGRERAVN